MTNWQKLKDWLENERNAAALRQAQSMGMGQYEAYHQMIFGAVATQMRKIEDYECCKSLEAAGY